MRFIRTGWPQTNDGPRHSVSGVAYAQRRSAERAIPGSMWDDGAHGQLSKRSQIYLNPGNIPPVVFLDNHTILYLDVPLAPPRAVAATLILVERTGEPRHARMAESSRSCKLWSVTLVITPCMISRCF